LGCHLPIEIWEIGQEVSEMMRQRMKAIDGLRFQDVNDYVANAKHWCGFQIKAFMLFYTKFEEVILLDADLRMFQSPEIIFRDENYLRTGAYFFRDLDKWKFSKLNNPIIQWKQKWFYNKFTSRAFYLARKKWLLNLLPIKSSDFPKEWDYLYEDDLPKRPVKEALQESGVVVINKRTHQKTVAEIFKLNDLHQETYQFVWGDKETFWIACLIANEPFYFNPTAGYRDLKTKRLSHDYKGELFFCQK
jgi:hypothetical protein